MCYPIRSQTFFNSEWCKMKFVKKIILSHPVGLHKLQVYPDLGLGYIAASAKNDGFTVRLVLHALSKQDIIKLLDGFNPHVWGLKLFAANTTLVKETIRLIKKHNPDYHCYWRTPGKWFARDHFKLCASGLCYSWKYLRTVVL